ncbi:3'-5' exonuclease [Condylostylus longicornis]|uniref:3'-5' exonuclease n=1 Tax=Condylostylus longicornis TaxID=2530218 RepID=UPI00244E13D0|nr:3'-5' exonuclease [Condylostylus longicornis]
MGESGINIPIKFIDKEGNADVDIKFTSRRVTRSNSNLEKPEVKPKLHECPYISYTGEIKYFTTTIDIACACDELLSYVETVHKETTEIPIAFDMEWPFSFKTGPGKSSVLQLCILEHETYVFSIGHLKKLPSALIALLTHPKVKLHGVNIKNDFRKLQRDFPDTNADKLIENCIDLAAMCNEIKNTSGRWSLERLVNYICRLQMDKSKKIRMSKWDVVPLNNDQLRYAAIDVYIGQVIYRKLEEEKLKKTEFDYENEIILRKLGLDF